MSGSDTSRNNSTDEQAAPGSISGQSDAPTLPPNDPDPENTLPPPEGGTQQSTDDAQKKLSSSAVSSEADQQPAPEVGAEGAASQQPLVQFLPQSIFNPSLSDSERSLPHAHVLLAKVTASNAFDFPPEEHATVSTPIEAVSKNASYHAHFEDGSWVSMSSGQSHDSHKPSSEATSTEGKTNAAQTQTSRSMAADVSQNVTERDFPTTSSSQDKARSLDHEPTVVSHSVRSSTIPSQVVPQPSLPEQVFSEPTPFGQMLPPQRCESRSCAMRRSTFNAMSCNMLPSANASTPNLEDPTPSAVPPYPTEPVLVEMRSGEQSSVQSDDYFRHISHWTEASTLPATTTPSGQSTSDIFTFLESSDGSSREKATAAAITRNENPELQEALAIQDGETNQFSGSKPENEVQTLTRSDEELLALLSSKTEETSGGNQQSGPAPTSEQAESTKQNNAFEPMDHPTDRQLSDVENKPNSEHNAGTDTDQQGYTQVQGDREDGCRQDELPPGPTEEPTSQQTTPVRSTIQQASGEFRQDSTRLDENQNNQNENDKSPK